ncbi:S41 family peptidase [Sulfitobacter sp. AS92]|uniref:S41 family peptidase n=1 Tax=Sulfitobacter sp. AS92 TaxID=3135783 RepID=UPI0031805810
MSALPTVNLRLTALVALLLTSLGANAGDLLAQATDYMAVADGVDETTRAFHYDPAELETAQYQQVMATIRALAETVETDDAFVEGFREIWRDQGPFSHMSLSQARGTSEEQAAFFDTFRTGGGGAVLSWDGRVAILTVNTMMGLDTIEEIDTAYAVIAELGAEKLIIDLRENGGGAFAIRPLVGHLMNERYDAGAFVAQRWNAQHRGQAPTLQDIMTVAPWEGWSVRAFWDDVQREPFIRVSFSPIAPVFDGPVYVLTSERTASASEIATEALQSSGRAVIIGERTAGEMLSQKVYDIPGGFHFFLPVADYFSVTGDRIEGFGIVPDIAVDAEDALNIALQQ